MKTTPFLRALALVLTLTATALHAQVPQILNYQGRVAVGDPPANFDGSGAFKFALVDDTGATSYWSNDGTSTEGGEPTEAVTLPVTKGLYSVMLGDTTLPNMTAIPNTVFANPDVRLRVWFDDGANGSQLLTPDQRITAVGYAMVAAEALTVPDGAITSAQLAPGAAAPPVIVAGSTQNAAANKAYTTTGASEAVFLLPATGELGDTIQITAAGTGGWRAENSTWTPRDSDRAWRSIASSADGTKLVAVVKGGKIYTSTDSGATLTPRDSDRQWVSVASSADGTKLIAVDSEAFAGTVYRSTDSGETWTPLSEDTLNDNDGWWSGVASSADGSTLVAVNDGYAPGNFIYVSTDSGTTWVKRMNDADMPPRRWSAVASSADGTKLVAVEGDVTGPAGAPNSGSIYLSNDSGMTWTAQAGAPAARWTSVASSGDGKRLLAVARDGQIHSSADFGVTWAAVESNRAWTAVASSADGSKRVAGVAGGQIYTDTSLALSGAQGTTATLQYLGNGQWAAVGQTQLAPNLSLGGTTSGTFVGDGSGLTNIPASAIVPVVPPAPPAGMVLIPAGAFQMGNSVEADTDITNAAPVSTTVSAFYMDVTEVTLSQWQSVYFWATSNGYTFAAGAGKGANHPVQTVSWYDCVKWCNARSEQAGLTPVYYTDDAQTTIYKTGNVAVTNAQVKWSASGYRLPTEAEWEKAARGGLSGQRFPWGNTITQNLANYYGASGSYAYDQGPNVYNPIGAVGGRSPATSPVGSFAANGYGLHDMAGNVFEWCWDRVDLPLPAYAGGTDPKGATTGSYRVSRGGSWGADAPYCRAADRNNNFPGSTYNSVGFRVARSSVP